MKKPENQTAKKKFNKKWLILPVVLVCVIILILLNLRNISNFIISKTNGCEAEISKDDREKFCITSVKIDDSKDDFITVESKAIPLQAPSSKYYGVYNPEVKINGKDLGSFTGFRNYRLSDFTDTQPVREPDEENLFSDIAYFFSSISEQSNISQKIYRYMLKEGESEIELKTEGSTKKITYNQSKKNYIKPLKEEDLDISLKQFTGYYGSDFKITVKNKSNKTGFVSIPILLKNNKQTCNELFTYFRKNESENENNWWKYSESETESNDRSLEILTPNEEISEDFRIGCTFDKNNPATEAKIFNKEIKL